MQPQPTEVSQNTQSLEHTQESSQPSQYGSHHEHDQASGHLLDGGDGRGSHSSLPSDPPAGRSVVVPQPRSPQTSSLGWLNDDNRPKSSTPIHRISQYEQALTPSPRKSPDLVGFKVIQGKKGSSGTPLTDFPNG